MKEASMHIKVKVLTGKSKETVMRKASDTFAISVTEKAEAGKANKRVIEILKGEFGNQKHIKLISGSRSPSKIFLIE